MMGLLLLGAAVAAIFDWRYTSRGGMKPTKASYGWLGAAVLICLVTVLMIAAAGAPAEGVGNLTGLLLTVVFVLWEFGRFRTRRANPLTTALTGAK